MQSVLDQISQDLGGRMLTLLSALAILVFGWLVAVLLAALARKGLRRTDLDNRIAQWILGEEAARRVNVEKWVGKAVYYILLLFVIIAFLQRLNLNIATEPLSQFLNQLAQFMPKLIGGSFFLLVAWIVARLLRLAVSRGLEAAKFDERVSTQAGLDTRKVAPLSKTLADAVYWLVFLVFLPVILSALELQDVMQPVEAMTNQILSFLPRLFAAGLILAIGWFLARIVQGIVRNLLAATGADELGERVGLGTTFGSRKLSDLTGLVVYLLIFISAIILSLNKLQLDAIAGPAVSMLRQVTDAIPAIIAATLLMMLAYLVGRLVAGLAANLLAGVGFNALLEKLGMAKPSAKPERMPSSVAGYLILVVIMLFAAIEASRLLGFETLADLLAGFTVFTGRAIVGLIVFGVGLYLANVVAVTVQSSGASQAPFLAVAARVSIIVLAGAIALNQMGLGTEIIQLAFGILLGAVAVASALAFGIGGRDIAAKKLQGWFDSMKKK